jgi:hypothetical protein
MHARFPVVLLVSLAGNVLAANGGPAMAAEEARVSIDWAKILRESKTIPTLQVVVNPMLLSRSGTTPKAPSCGTRA